MNMEKINIRKIVIGFLLAIICFNLNPVSIMAQNNQINYKTYKVLIDENIEIYKGFDINAIIENGRTLVPATKMYKSLGYDIKWDGATQMMTVVKGNTVIKLKVGNNYGEKNNKKINIDIPIRYINNDIYVSLGFISESTGVVFSKKDNNIYGYDKTVAYYGNNAAERAVVKIDTAGKYAQNKYKTSKQIICEITDPDMTELEKLYEIIDYIYENSQDGMVNFHGGNKGYNADEFDSDFSVITHGVGNKGAFGETVKNLISAADIRNSITAMPGAIGYTWNLIQIDGENYHIDLSDLVFEKHDSYSTFDKDHSYHGLFTTDSIKEKRQVFSNVKYQNYTPLKSSSNRFKEISNTWYAARDGKWIYFNRFDDKPGFYKVNIDGTGMTQIHEDTPFDLKVQGDWIYYRVFNYGIIEEKFYKIRKDGSDKTDIPIDPKANKYFVTEDGIYYSSDKIYKTDLEGKDQKVISKYPAYAMKLDGDWIYYINSKDNNKLYKVNINNGINELVINEEGLQVFVIGKDFITYKIPTKVAGSWNWYNTISK